VKLVDVVKKLKGINARQQEIICEKVKTLEGKDNKEEIIVRFDEKSDESCMWEELSIKKEEKRFLKISSKFINKLIKTSSS